MLALLLAGSALCVLSMTALWLLGRRLHNYSFVDLGWSAHFALLAVLYGLAADGWPARRAMIGAMYAIWSLRLAAHLARRIIGAFCPGVLFPYARQAVSDLIMRGGFPPFLLPPVNFDALFQQSAEQQAAGTAPQVVN